MKSSIITRIFLGLSIVFLIASVAICVLAGQKPDRVLEAQMTSGNQFLNEGQYEEAIAQFQAVLDAEPQNEEAILGIMEASYRRGDQERVKDCLMSFWRDAEKDAQTYERNESVLLQMTQAAGSFFETTQDYAAFLSDLQEAVGNEQIARMKEDAYRAIAAEQIGAQDYAAACEWLGKTDGQQDALARLYQVRGQQAWQDGDLPTAAELYDKAFSCAQGNAGLQEAIVKDIERYVGDCMDGRRYDEAGKLMELAQKFGGSDALKEYADERTACVTLQKLTGELDQAFRSDDKNAVVKIMNSGEFGEYAGSTGAVCYSESLLGGSLPEGKGSAIYMIDGIPFVYYGEYVKGARQGSGLWCISSGEKELYQYTLEWANDLPNGSGKLESFETLVNRDQKGEETGTETISTRMEFQCVNGVMDGECVQHCEITAEESYSFDLTITLENGYNQILGEEKYPAKVIGAYNGGEPIVAYAVIKRAQAEGSKTDPNETYVWREYSTEPYTVAGFEQFLGKAAIGEGKLTLE